MKLTVNSGQLPLGWTIKSLGDICKIVTGKLNANAAVENGKYPFFTCSRQIFSIDNFAFDCEAILLAGNNAVGEFNVKHYKGKFNAYQRTYVITINREDEILYKYLYLQIENSLKEFKSKSVGAGTKFLKLEMIKNLRIPVPPLEEQKRIVAILDEAFAGIDQAIRNTEKNLANAREIFESYLNSIFINRGDDWVEKKLGDVCTLKSGTTVMKNIEQESGDIPYVKVADMNLPSNEFKIMTSSRFLNLNDIKINSIFPVGTTIFPKRGGAILTNKKRMIGIPICADLNIMGVIPSETVYPEFLYYYFLNIDMRSLGSGSSIPQINNYDIDPLLIPLPLLEKQKEIVLQLDKLKAETQRLEAIYQRKIEALKELKQSILQKAFRGELTNPNSQEDAI